MLTLLGCATKHFVGGNRRIYPQHTPAYICGPSKIPLSMAVIGKIRERGNLLVILASP